MVPRQPTLKRLSQNIAPDPALGDDARWKRAWRSLTITDDFKEKDILAQA